MTRIPEQITRCAANDGVAGARDEPGVGERPKDILKD